MFQAGLDLSRWPEEPPVSLRAHRGCWEARQVVVVVVPKRAEQREGFGQLGMEEVLG